MGEWYVEYELQVNRPGLLGDIASLLGMLRVDIVTINGVDGRYRGMLVHTDHDQQIKRFELIASTMDAIVIHKIREPKLRDVLAVRHGHYIQRGTEDPVSYTHLTLPTTILV